MVVLGIRSHVRPLVPYFSLVYSLRSCHFVWEFSGRRMVPGRGLAEYAEIVGSGTLGITYMYAVLISVAVSARRAVLMRSSGEMFA